MKEPRMARPEDRQAAIRAFKQGKLGITWHPSSGTWPARDFAKAQGWPAPLWGFKKAFIKKMLESDENFDLVLIRSGIDVYIPNE